MGCSRPLITAIAAALAAGCRTIPPETVRVDGSTGVMPLVSSLAKEYHQARPNVTMALGAGMGSSARLDAVAQGTIDIALASHGLVVADLERRGLTAHKFADVPVVFAVNASVPVTVLSEDQICGIYRGAIVNWRALGGPDLPIVAVTRPVGEVDVDVVIGGVPCFRAITLHSSVVSKEKPEEMAAYLAATKGAIGMTTTTVVGKSGDSVRALSLDGVAPTGENVSAGKYRLTRPSFLVTKTAAPPGAARFIDFIRGRRGEDLIRASGAIPSGG